MNCIVHGVISKELDTTFKWATFTFILGECLPLALRWFWEGRVRAEGPNARPLAAMGFRFISPMLTRCPPRTHVWGLTQRRPPGTWDIPASLLRWALSFCSNSWGTMAVISRRLSRFSCTHPHAQQSPGGPLLDREVLPKGCSWPGGEWSPQAFHSPYSLGCSFPQSRARGSFGDGPPPAHPHPAPWVLPAES